MLDLENNNWIILDLLGNILEMYAIWLWRPNLYLDQFWITQAELCIESTFVKINFMFVKIFLDIYENSRRKNCIINPFYSKNPKIINWSKKWHFHFHTFLCTKTKCENKKIIPLLRIGMTTVKTMFLSNSRYMPFQFP